MAPNWSMMGCVSVLVSYASADPVTAISALHCSSVYGHYDVIPADQDDGKWINSKGVNKGLDKIRFDPFARTEGLKRELIAGSIDSN